MKKFKERVDIKRKIKKKHHTITDLSIALQINYETLGHYLSGRRMMPEGFEKKILDIVDFW